jgi:two-component system OmpR family sensor kinase
MTSPPLHARLRRWLRGVRARLMLTYLLAAAVLAVAGISVFTLVLGSGLRASVDAGLQTRANSLEADVRSGNIQQTEPAPRIGTALGEGDLQAFTAVYDAGGQLAEANPSLLPAAPLTAADLASRRSGTWTGYLGGEQFRVLTQPVNGPDGRWLVAVGQNLNTINDVSNEVRRTLYFAVPVGLLLVGLGAWLLSGAALKPVDRMRGDAQRLSEHDAAGRITEPPTTDSLNQLARTFNTLLDRLHGSLERQRALVADAGHELRTPLAVLQTELETAVRPSRSRDDLVDSITHARAEVSRLAILAEDLLLLAHADGGAPLIRRQLTDIGALIDDTVAAHHGRAESAGIELRTMTGKAPLIGELDPVAVRRVLDNLLSNALRQVPTGGSITVAAELLTPERGPVMFALTVSDTGPGFPAEFLPQAFERFSRAEQSRSRLDNTAGSGLGLAIVDTLVKAHGGAVSATNPEEGGAAVALRIPVGDSTGASRRPVAGSASTAGRRR